MSGNEQTLPTTSTSTGTNQNKNLVENSLI